MSGPGGLLALHLDPLVGAWAYGCPDDKPDSGTWKWPLSSDNGEIGAALFDVLAAVVKVNQPAGMIAIAPFLDDADTEARAKLMITSIALTTCAQVYAYRRRLKLAIAGVPDMHTTLWGKQLKGRQLDDCAISYCRSKRGWPVLTTAPAHALALWAYGMEMATK